MGFSQARERKAEELDRMTGWTRFTGGRQGAPDAWAGKSVTLYRCKRACAPSVVRLLIRYADDPVYRICCENAEKSALRNPQSAIKEGLSRWHQDTKGKDRMTRLTRSTGRRQGAPDARAGKSVPLCRCKRACAPSVA